jgi:hypothetical protein
LFPDIKIVAIERLELGFAPRPWPFADARRAEIDRHFAALKRERPALWNGRVLLLHDHAIGGRCSRRLSRKPIRKLHRLARLGLPDQTIKNCFPSALYAARTVILGSRCHGLAHHQCWQDLFPGGNARSQ